MSVYPKPTAQQGAIFNPDLWIVSDVNGVSVDYLNENYLQFPVAQGFETLNGMTNLQSTTIGKNLIMSGEADVNYIEFPDGTQQFTANGSGTGDALLDGGTSSNPQDFTGYNNFSNADGQITLTNTTNANSVNIASDATNSKQLDIQGALSIGNSSNLSTTVLNSVEASSVNYLNITGGLICSESAQFDGASPGTVIIGNGNGTGDSIYLTSKFDTDNSIYGLQITNGGLYLGNVGGTPDASYFVLLGCGEGADGTLKVNGNLDITGTTITFNGSTFTAGATSLSINKSVDITGNLTITGTVSGATSSATLSQSANIEETIQYDGSIQLYGGTTNRSIYLNYNAQTDLQIQQNFGENLEVLSGLTLSPNKNLYPGSTNQVDLVADGVNNGQLDIIGALQTNGQVKITGSGNGITFPDGTTQTTASSGGTSVLGTNNTWTGTNAFNTSTPTTTITQTYPQATSTTEFATIGYVNTGISDATQYAALLNYGTSVSPQTFTSYNQINLLSYNNQSCPQFYQNTGHSYATGSGSQWSWYKNIPYTLGNGFAFAFSTNNTPTAYDMGNTQAIITVQSNSVISGTGYAIYQPYISNGTTYDAYILNITGYAGTPTLVAYTLANGIGQGFPQIIIQTNDTNPYYNNNNIKMNLYVYPQGIV